MLEVIILVKLNSYKRITVLWKYPVGLPEQLLLILYGSRKDIYESSNLLQSAVTREATNL